MDLNGREGFITGLLGIPHWEGMRALGEMRPPFGMTLKAGGRQNRPYVGEVVNVPTQECRDERGFGRGMPRPYRGKGNR